MMRRLATIISFLVFALFAPNANAQFLPRWFGLKTSEKKTPEPDSRRLTEVNVEVAWLADPVTFPYYLEARATPSQLEVRGYVPDKAVREHAVRIAQVYSSLPVVDAMKEHPSLLVKPSQMAPQQLHSSVMSSLKVALPKQQPQLRAECRSDGKVLVMGTVSTVEEKAAVSHALRRLHGCTSVDNLTTVTSEVAQKPRDNPPIIKTSNSSEKPVVALENKTKSWWPFSKASKTTEEPPLLENPRKSEGPILIPSVPEPKKDPAKVSAAAPVSNRELQKRIQAAIPKLRSVEVQFTSSEEVRITLELASDSELKSTAERVFALPELQNYRAELQFKITAP